MKITLLTVGKNADRQIEDLIERYVKRLTHYVKFETRNLPDVRNSGKMTADIQKQIEGQNILAAIRREEYVVLLDERGETMTSREFSKFIGRHLLNATRDITFVVGGAYGFSKAVYDRADTMISLSRMTLTHEMVRLFFVEQVYRAFTILRGENYHHD